MSYQDQISTLETTLQSIKDQYPSECVFSKDKLSELQTRAKEGHSPSESFFAEGVRVLTRLLQQKFGEGYTYRDHEAAAIQYVNGNIAISLIKPDYVTDAELAELTEKVEQQYLSDIAASKPRLIAEIATVQLKLEQLKQQQKLQEKTDAAYEKQLRKVEQELLGTAESEVTI